MQVKSWHGEQKRKNALAESNLENPSAIIS